MTPIEKYCHDRKITTPRAAKDPRHQFWKSSNIVPHCLPSKRPNHDVFIAPSHLLGFENTLKCNNNDKNNWQNYETREESFIDWKPIKWNRFGMFSSREPKKAMLQTNDVEEAGNGVIETIRKKTRLNWGEGLAKFDKIKSQIAEVIATGSSSVASNFMAGACDTLCIKVKNMDNGVDNLDVLAADVNTLTRLGSSLVDSLQCDNPNSRNSSLAKFTATKVTIFKAIISKVLEVTQTKIDSFEKELVSLQSESGDKFPCLTIVDSLLVSQSAKSCDEGTKDFDKATCLESLQIAPFDEDNLETLCNMIISSNKSAIEQASEVYAKLLPIDCGKIIDVKFTSSTFSPNEASIKEKIVEKERFSRFKEKVLTIKYRAFNYLWKKDLSLRIQRKSALTFQKHQLLVKTIGRGCKKNRSSICNRFRFPGNQISLVATSKMITYTSQLISKSHDKVDRNFLKMPTLVLDQKDKMISIFKSSNGLVEDPLPIEKGRVMINPWTLEERKIFVDKFATFGKDFRKIASFLDLKTTADCVEFYYKNYKLDCLEKSEKKMGAESYKLCKAKTCLMGSRENGKYGVNVDFHDVLDEALVKANRIQGNRRTCSRKLHLWRKEENVKISTDDDNNMERLNNYDVLQDERESIAAELLVSKFNSLSSKATSSSIAGDATRELVPTSKEHRGSPTCFNDDDDKCEADIDVMVELKSQIHDSNTTTNTSQPSAGISCSRLTFGAENQPHLFMEKSNYLGSCFEDPFTTTNTMLQKTVGVVNREEKQGNQNGLSFTYDFMDGRPLSGLNSINIGGHQLHNPSSSSSHAEATKIHQFSPLDEDIGKQVEADVNYSSLPIELPLLSQNIDQTDVHYKTLLQQSADLEKNPKTVILKLFGKIINIPSST